MGTDQELYVGVNGQSLRLDPGQVLTLGRGRDCDVTVNDIDVSRRHVQLRSDSGRWQLHDLGSSNGTWVNGHRVHGYCDLVGGEDIHLGRPQGPALSVTLGAPSNLSDDVGNATTYRAESTSAPMPRVTHTGPSGRAAPSPTDSPAGPPSGAQLPSGATPTSGGPVPSTSARPPSSAMPTTSASVAPELYRSVTGPSAPVRLPRAAKAPAQRSASGDVFRQWNGQVEAAPTGRMTVAGAAPQAMAMPTGTVTIGRGSDNEIVIQDLLASRKHVRLVPQGDTFAVEDLGSRNGTYINGHRITRGTLREDDLLAVGRTRFTLKAGRLVASEDEGDVTFVANHLSFTLPDGKKLIDDVSFGLEGSSLVAVIGPSGAGKSTLLKALIGAQKATEGEVYYDGRDLYDNYEDLRHRIGVVPQDDVVHPELSVRQALRYAAELRFPDDLDRASREARVEEVIDELGLTQHADTQVARLSGGQRKRTSVALELLTRPSLLFLDEPTSGLDPGLDKRVMLTLRGLADGGRTVVVITHNVASLGVCDRVLMLAPGGKVAYFGPPDEMLPFFSARDHADVFNTVTDDPELSQRTFAESPLMSMHVEGPLSAPRAPVTSTTDDDTSRRQQSIPRQLSTLVRRQFRVMLADRGFCAFMLLLPLALAGLTLLVPGSHGLHTVFPPKAGTSTTDGPPSAESSQITTLLIIGAVFMGLAATIRELVAERPIFLREKAVGLSAFAYLSSKLFTYGLLIALQSALMVGVVVAAKDAPDHPVAIASSIAELFVATFLTGLVAVALGLLLSSFAKTSEQVMPLLVMAIMAALVFSGGLFELDTAGMRYAGMFFPSRWGLAMANQTADVVTSMTQPVIQGGPKPPEKHWDPWWLRDTHNWEMSAAALGIQFVVVFLAAWWLTRRRKSM